MEHMPADQRYLFLKMVWGDDGVLRYGSTFRWICVATDGALEQVIRRFRLTRRWPSRFEWSWRTHVPVPCTPDPEVEILGHKYCHWEFAIPAASIGVEKEDFTWRPL